MARGGTRWTAAWRLVIERSRVRIPPRAPKPQVRAYLRTLLTISPCHWSFLCLGKRRQQPAVGAVVHVLLSAQFGILFALAVPQFRSNGSVALAGTVYGLLLYVVNCLVLTPLAFTTFRKAN